MAGCGCGRCTVVYVWWQRSEVAVALKRARARPLHHLHHQSLQSLILTISESDRDMERHGHRRGRAPGDARRCPALGAARTQRSEQRALAGHATAGKALLKMPTSAFDHELLLML